MMKLLHQKILRNLLFFALFFTASMSWGQFSTNFENVTQGGYADATVLINNVSWDFSDALVGNLSSDAKNGSKSLRMRNSSVPAKMEMTTSIAGGIGNFSLQYAKYSGDSNSAFKVEYSVNDGNWVQIGSTVSVSNANLQTFSANNLNVAGNIKVRIVKTSGGTSARLNIDDISWTSYIPSPVISVSNDNTTSNFTTVYGTPSAVQTFQVSGSYLINGISIDPPPGFQVSSTSATAGFGANGAAITLGTTTVNTTTIYVRLAANATPASNYGNNNITLTSGGATINVSLNNGTVSQKAVTISGLSATNNDKIYDGTNAATLSASLTPGSAVGIDNVTLSTVSLPVYSSANAGGPYTITTNYALSGAQSAYYTLTQPGTITGSISAKSLTLSGGTVQNKTYDGISNAILTVSPSLIGVINTDDVTLTGTPVPVFASNNVGNHQISITSGYTLTGTEAGNYSLTLPSQPTGLTGSIFSKELTITGIVADNKVYDANTSVTISGTPTLSGIVNSEDVALDSSTATFAFTNANAGTSIPVTASGYTLGGADFANYSLTQPSTLNADITAKELTITGIQISNKVYDGNTSATITGTPTLSGIVNSEDVALDSSAATAVFITDQIGAAVPVIVSGYTLTGADIANYSLTQPTGLTANITSASLQNQTIMFDPLADATYGDMPFALTATAAPSGLTVTYTSSDEGVATVSGNTVTIVGIGSTIITANQSGDVTYNPAPAVQQTLVVNKKALTVTGAVVTDKTYDKNSDAVITSGTLSGIVNPDVVVLDGTTGIFTDINANNGISVSPQYSISGADAGKYTLTQPTLSGNILPAPLTLTNADANDKVYDGTDSAVVTGTLSGILPGDTVTLDGTGTFASSIIGTSIIVTSTSTLTGTDAANYTLTQPTGLSADITALGLTVNATANDKEYDRTTDASITITQLNGVKIGDDVTVSGNGSFNNFNVENNKTVTANLVLSGAQAGNYTLTQPTGLTASITAKTITVDITNTTAPTKNYDGTASAALTNTILNGVIAGDETNVNALTGTFAQTTPGTGIAVNNVILTGTAAANYTLTQPTTLVGDILPKPLTLTSAVAADKVYDGTNIAVITGTLSGIIPTENVTFDGTGTFASVDVANGIQVTSTASLNGIDAANYTLTQPVNLSANITAKQLTINADAQNKAYDQTDTAVVNNGVIVASDIVAGDDVSLVATSVSGTFNTPNVGNAIPVTAAFSLQGTDAGNYSIAPQTYPANITALNLTVDVTAASVTTKTYDNNTNAVITGAILNGVLGGDIVNATTGSFASANAGTDIPVTINLSGPQALNYTITQPATAPTGTINKKALTANAENKTKIQGAVNPTLTISYIGFVSGQTAANALDFIAPTATTTAITSSPSGAYPITLTGGSAANYDFVLNNEWLIVGPATPPTSVILAWDFTGEDQLSTSNAGVKNVNLDSSSALTRGSGASPSQGIHSFRTQGFQSNGISTSNNDYFQFTVSSSSNNQVSLSSIAATFRGTTSFAAAPGLIHQFAYSLNGTTFTLINTPITSIGTTVNNAAQTSINVDVSGVSALQNVPANTTVTFRYYASGRTNTGGWGFYSTSPGNYGLAVRGSIIPSPQPPVINSSLTGNSPIGDTDTYQITATGSPEITLSASNLPTGASIDNAGLITFDGTTPANTYNITLTASSYYGTDTKTLVYTINKLNQVITFDPDPIPTKFLGDAPFLFDAATSSALPITSWVSSNPAVATIAADGTVTIVGVGTTTLTASNSGDATYNAVSAGRVLTVLPTPTLAATPDPISFTAIQGQGASTPVQLTSITGSNLVPAADNITLSVSAGFEISVGIGAYTNSGTFAYTLGTINESNPLISIRLAAGHAEGLYNGTLTIAGGNATVQIPLSAVVELAPAITTTAVSYGPYCPDTSNNISLSYTTQGTFATGNFYVQHSDASGVFPNDLSNTISSASGNSTIAAILPANLTPGNYRVRIVHLSSSLVLTSSTNDNGTDIVIAASPTLSGVSTTCSENNAPISLSGLLANAKFTVDYTVNGGSVQQALDVESDASGDATFEIPVTSANNGETVVISQLTRTDIVPGCSKTFTTNNTATINITPKPTAVALAFCKATTVADLTANGNDLKWYNVETAGTELADNETVTTGNYYVSQTLNTCESERTLVAVTVNLTPKPTAVALAFCKATTVADLTATGNDLKWYNVETAGTELADNETVTTGNYYVSQALNSCESERTLVAVTVNVTPKPTAVALAFCKATTVADLTATGNDLKWYNVETAGTELADNETVTTGNYYVSQTLNSCESERTLVAVTVNVTPKPTTVALAFCKATTVADLTANGNDLKWYNVETAGTELADNETVTTGNYYVSQTLNTCESERTLVAVTVNLTPKPTAVALAFCKATTVADLTANGSNLKWYKTLNGGTALANNDNVTTGNYYVSQTLNTCESERTLVAVTVNVTPKPTAVALAFCKATTVADLTANGSNLKWYKTLNGGTALANNDNVTTGNYYVSQTLNTCESERTLVAVTVNVTPKPTAVALAFCKATTVADLTANGNDLKWYKTLNGGTALVNNETVTTGNYYVSQTLNTCESERTLVAVTVNVTPKPTAVALAFCKATTVADLTANGNDLKWYKTLNGGTALVNNETVTTGNYYVSQTLNACESERTLVAVTVNVTPKPTAVALAFCKATTVADLTANGSNLKWYKTLNGGTALVNNENVTTGNYYVSQTLNTCESERTLVTVTVNVTPKPTAVALAFCKATTVADLTANGSNLKWYNTLNSGTALANNDNVTTGNYYVSQTLNTCESERTLVAVTVNVTPKPTAVALAFCKATTVADLTANGSNLKWYNTLNGGTALANNDNVTTGNYYVSQTLNTCESERTLVAVTVNVTPKPTAVALSFCKATTVADLTANGNDLKWYNVENSGTELADNETVTTGNYYVSQTLNACESERTLVAVTVNITPKPTATPLSFCKATTVADLIANGDNLKWYNVENGGIALANNDNVTTGSYYVSQTLNGCESGRVLVEIVVKITPKPTAISMVFCQEAFVAHLAATGSDLKWYDVQTGGTVLTGNTQLSTRSYYVSQTIDGCESERTEVSVTIHITPKPIVTTPVTFCSSATIADLTATGDNLKWYSYPSSGPILSDTTPLVTGNYYVSQTIDGCESPRALVAVTINTTQLPSGSSSQVYCANASVGDLMVTITGTELKWYNLQTGGTALADNTPLATGDYYVSQTIDGCESLRKKVSVVVNGTEAPEGVTEQLFTEDVTVADLKAEGENITWYSSEEDAIEGINPLSDDTELVSGETYYATQTINGCESNTVLAVTVTIVLSIDEVEKFSFSYYPNPVINELHITSPTTITNVTVYSLSGQEVINQKWNKQDGIIDMSSLAAEVYMVKVNFGKAEKVIKVIRTLK